MPNSDAPWTWGNSTIFAGIRYLHELVIDTDKNWLTRQIKNVGYPTADTDSATKKYVDDIPPLFGTQNDVTASRAIGPVYQNQNPVPIAVIVELDARVVTLGSTELRGKSTVTASCDTINPPSAEIVASGIQIELTGLANAAHSINTLSKITVIVPADYYYKLDYDQSGSGVIPTVDTWTEYGGTGTAV